MEQRSAAVSLSSGRIPSLDGLRALSIWAVLLGHVSIHFVATPLHSHIFRYISGVLSYFGVTIFFVISGFLITTLLLREQSRTSRIHVGRFYQRRAVRILPASLFYVAVMLLLCRPAPIQAVYALTFTTSYFFEQAFSALQHLWSLSVEEQFYFLWPLVFLLGVKSARRYCWGVMLIAPIIRIAMKYSGSHNYAHAAPAIADALAAGCLLAFYYQPAQLFVKKHFASGPAFAVLAFGTICIAGLIFKFDVVPLWGFVFLLIALTTCAAIERRDRFLNSKPLVWTGLLSYSLYLWQQPMLVFHGPFDNIAVRLVGTYALAYLSYRFVEQPMLRFRVRQPGDVRTADTRA